MKHPQCRDAKFCVSRAAGFVGPRLGVAAVMFREDKKDKKDK